MIDENDEKILSRLLADTQKISRHIHGCTLESFCDDELRQDAVITVLMTIGERVKKLSDDFKKANPQIPWKYLRELRNFAAHEYDSLQMEDVWLDATIDIPAIQSQLQAILKYD